MEEVVAVPSFVDTVLDVIEIYFINDPTWSYDEAFRFGLKSWNYLINKYVDDGCFKAERTRPQNSSPNATYVYEKMCLLPKWIHKDKPQALYLETEEYWITSFVSEIVDDN